MVRLTVVTGIPSTRVTSLRPISARWTLSRAFLRAPLLAMVTCTGPPRSLRIPCSSAALSWLTTAVSPHASTAAMNLSSGAGVGPTRKTAR